MGNSYVATERDNDIKLICMKKKCISKGSVMFRS